MINYAKIMVELNKQLGTDTGTFTVTLANGTVYGDPVSITAANFASCDMAESIPFVRPNILYSPSRAEYACGVVNGTFVVDIFFDAGSGMGVGYAIGSKLDEMLAAKTFGKDTDFNGIQTYTSSINDRGIDRESKEIYRLEYNLPFVHNFNL